MANRVSPIVKVLFLIPLAIGTGILATHTLGESLTHRNPESVGVAVALLVVTAAAYLLFLVHAPENPQSRLALTLVLCGTACIVAAIFIQVFIAAVAWDAARRSGDILMESVKQGRNLTNVNINADMRGSVQGVSYLGLLAGVWLAMLGVRLGTAARQPALVRPLSTAPLSPTKTDSSIHLESS